MVDGSLNKFECIQLLLSEVYFEGNHLIYDIQKINLDIAGDLVSNLKKHQKKLFKNRLYKMPFFI